MPSGAVRPSETAVQEIHDEGEGSVSRVDRHPDLDKLVTRVVHQKVEAAVSTSRNYRHVLWYMTFVGAYLAVLYLQASAYPANEVVQTLRAVVMPDDGSTTVTFSSPDEVLAYLGSKIVAPAWQDPVCGDQKCEYPWEFPAWGPFGCRADCGLQPNTTAVVVTINADFTGHPSIAPGVLMANVKWNLCLQDLVREKRGEAELCWFATDQVFTQPQESQVYSMTLIDGTWYISLQGDYAGLVSGAVYDASNASAPVVLSQSPEWGSCSLAAGQATASVAQNAVRRLLAAYTGAHAVGGEAGSALLMEAVREVDGVVEEMRRKRDAKGTGTAAAERSAAESQGTRPQPPQQPVNV